MPPKPLSLPSALAFTRKVWILMLISIPLFVLVVEYLNPKERRLPQSFLVTISALAIGCAFLWISFRGRYIGTSRLELAADPRNMRALKKWQVGHLMSFLLSEAVALYGINLRFRGLTFSQAAPFCLVGLLLMIFSAPAAPAK